MRNVAYRSDEQEKPEKQDLVLFSGLQVGLYLMK